MHPSAQGYNQRGDMLLEIFGIKHAILRSLLEEVISYEVLSLGREHTAVHANKPFIRTNVLEQLESFADLTTVETIDRNESDMPQLIVMDWLNVPRSTVAAGKRAYVNCSNL